MNDNRVLLFASDGDLTIHAREDGAIELVPELGTCDPNPTIILDVDHMEAIASQYLKLTSKAGKRPVSIAAVQRMCQHHDLQAAAVFSVRRDGTIDVTTYGETAKGCRAIGWWAHGFADAGALSVVPFTTVFGWGNKGVPKPLSDKEWNSISARVPEEFR